MALSDATMDKWLAENLLGWKDLDWHDDYYRADDDPDARAYRGWFGTDPSGNHDRHVKGFFSSDPIHSQVIIQAMVDRGYGISKIRRPSDNVWSVTFFDATGGDRPSAMGVDSNEARATAAAARAAIEAYQGKPKESPVGTKRGTDW